MSELSLVGFYRQDHKVYVDEIEAELINASQVINKETGEIVSRTFSTFSTYFNYRIYYVPEELLGYQAGRHDAHYRVEQDLIEDIKISNVFWQTDDSSKEYYSLKDNFMSWELQKGYNQIVSTYADVKVGELSWSFDVEANNPTDEDDISRSTIQRRRQNEVYNQITNSLGRRSSFYYKLLVDLFDESLEFDSTRSLSYTVVLPDKVWGVKGVSIPDGMDAWMQNSEGQREPITSSKKINIGNKIHLEKRAESTEPLIIYFYGDYFMSNIEFIDSTHVGWEHHDEIPNTNNPEPPTGDYDYSFPNSFLRIDKSGWREVVNNVQVRNNDFTEPEVDQLATEIVEEEINNL